MTAPNNYGMTCDRQQVGYVEGCRWRRVVGSVKISIRRLQKTYTKEGKNIKGKNNDKRKRLGNEDEMKLS
jgi:hypothetical protein